MEKVVLILSGGMDSTTLLYDLRDQEKEIHAITYDYGQKDWGLPIKSLIYRF